MRRVASSLTTVALAYLVLFAGVALRQSAAQEVKPAAPAKSETKKPTKARGRLPAFYNQVVDDEQRERIYTVQQKYADEIDRLEAQLNDLIDKRDAEVAAVLTAEQLEQVNQLATAAKSKQECGTALESEGAVEKAAAAAEAPPAKTAGEPAKIGKTAEAKPIEAKPVETKPAAKPVETKPKTPAAPKTPGTPKPKKTP